MKNPVVFCGDTHGIQLAPYNVLASDRAPDATAEVPDTGASALRPYERYVAELQSDVYGRGFPVGEKRHAFVENLGGNWASPLECSKERSDYRLLHPKEFAPLVVPGISPTAELGHILQRSHGRHHGSTPPDGGGGSAASSSGSGSGKPLSRAERTVEEPWRKYLILPEVYAKELERKDKDVRGQMQCGQLPERARAKLMNQFQSWLRSTERFKQLQDLAKIQHAGTV